MTIICVVVCIDLCVRERLDVSYEQAHADEIERVVCQQCRPRYAHWMRIARVERKDKQANQRSAYVMIVSPCVDDVASAALFKLSLV